MADRPYHRDGSDGDDVSAADRLISRIGALDEDLIDLIMQRARLLNELKRALPEKVKNRPHPEVDMEKQLWRTFEKHAPAEVRDPAAWRTLFTLLQSVIPKGRHFSEAEQDGFLLSPKRAPLDMTLMPPTSLVQALVWTGLAAMCPEEAALDNVTLSDPLIEAVKGLNQIGAHLSWGEHAILSRGTAEVSFSEKVVHCGDHELTFYLLLFLGATLPCSVKYTGGSDLKMANVKSAANLMGQLGARLVFMAPRSTGLPVRLEASAMLPEAVILPDDFPPAALIALCLAGTRFPDGLILRWQDNVDDAFTSTLEQIVPVFRDWSLAFELSTGSVTIGKGTPKAPGQPALDADPLLSAMLLSLPLFTHISVDGFEGSRAALTRAPASGSLWNAYQGMLRAAGLTISREKGAIVSTVGPSRTTDKTPLMDTSHDPRALPLALALGVAMFALDRTSRAIKGLRIALPPTPLHLEAARDLAMRFGLHPETDGDELLLTPTGEGIDQDAGAPWTSPSAEFSLAMAMLAFVRPGLRLTNPGSVTSLLPSFWHLYNGLPSPKEGLLFRKKPSKETSHDQPQRSTRRRIRT